MYEFPEIKTDEFVHGICVLSSNEASAVSTDPNLDYISIENVGSGTRVWRDRTYTLAGVESSPCQGSIYLQPSLHKSIDRNAKITIMAALDESYADICIFVEDSNRDGGFGNNLQQIDGRFVDHGTATGLAWEGLGRLHPFRVFCRSIPDQPTLAPTIAPSLPPVVVFPQTYDFPQIQTNQFVHGICVKSTSSYRNIGVESTDPDLQYALIDNMASGVKAWDDRNYIIIGVEDSPCAGSTFLQPSLHKVCLSCIL